MSLKAVRVSSVFVWDELTHVNIVRFAVKIVKCMREFSGIIESTHL